MFKEKPKRGKKNRFYFALVLLLPMLLVSRQIEFGILGDSIAMTVMICAAIYLTYQLVEWLIGKIWS